MFTKTRHAFLASGTAAALTATAGRTNAPAAQFEFKCATDLANDHPSVLRLTQMWAAVEQESGGRIHTQFFPNNQLGGDTGMFTQLRVGALQFQLINPGPLAAVVPVADISRLGFTYKDEDEGLRVMDSPLGAYIRQDASTKGLHIMRTHWNAGMNHICSSVRAIRTPDDLHGFKIRVQEGKTTLDLFKALGSSPVVLPFGELYVALQTKLVDGFTAALVSIEKSKFYEVQKYLSLTNNAWTGNWLVANGDAWKSLPSDLQDVIERNNTKFSVLGQRDTKALNASAVAQLTGQGLTVNQVDQAPFRARLRPYFEYWAGVFGTTAWALLETALGRKLT